MPASDFVAFDGPRLLARGSRLDVALALRDALAAGAAGPLLAFDGETGGEIDFDLRGGDVEIAEHAFEADGRTYPAGSWIVSFAYRAPGLDLGLAASSVGIGAVLVVVGVRTSRRIRARRTAVGGASTRPSTHTE